jgi:hypothetical protein
LVGVLGLLIVVADHAIACALMIRIFAIYSTGLGCHGAMHDQCAVRGRIGEGVCWIVKVATPIVVGRKGSTLNIVRKQGKSVVVN